MEEEQNKRRKLNDSKFEEIKSLLEGGASPDTVIDDISLLSTAAGQGDVRVIQLLLERGANVDLEDTDGCPLLSAVQHGHTEVVKMLLEKGASIGPLSYNIVAEDEAEDFSQGLTPLQIAARNGNVDIAKLLLDRGAHEDNNIGRSALSFAVLKGHIEMVRLLLDRGVDAGYGPFTDAARLGLLPLVQLFIERGATNLSLPLYYAASNGHLDVMKELLSQGADVNGSSALYVACQEDQLEAIKLLVESGANIEAKGVLGISPIFDACMAGSLEAVKFMISKGAKTNLTDDYGATLLHYASGSGNEELVKFLLDGGLSVNAQNLDGSTPLNSASSTQVVKLLLERGANVNLAANRKNTPLHTACARGNLDVIRSLLENGATIEAELLHNGLRAQNTDLVKLLLTRGEEMELNEDTEHSLKVKLLLESDTRTSKEEGCTILHVATQNKHFDVVKHLALEDSALDIGSCKTALVESLVAGRLDVSELLIYRCPQIAAEVPRAVMLAAQSPSSNAYTIMTLLIKYGANLNYSERVLIGEAIRSQRTPLHAAVINRNAAMVWQLVLHGADPTIDYVKPEGSKTVWDLCDGDKTVHEALKHFWSPTTHKIHPKWTRDAIVCTMLIARRQQWPVDQLVLHKLLSYIAYGWHKPSRV